jgi:hypothetical protein
LSITHHEKRDALNSDIDEEKACSADVVGNIHHGALHVVNFDLLVLIRSALRNETLGGNHAFALVKEPAVFGVRRHQKWGTKTNDDGEDALKEEGGMRARLLMRKLTGKFRSEIDLPSS